MKIASLIILLALPAAAQDIKLPASLDRLASKASNSVDINLDMTMLQLAARFLSGKDPDEARVKKLVGTLKGITVKSFEFDSRGEYNPSDLDEFRAQFRSPGWTRIVGVKSRNGENSDIYLKSENGQIAGLVVIVAEPRELTIVSILGTINPDDLRDLGGHFGIPRMDVFPARKGNKEF
jgi:hypothetical protein